MSSHSQKSPDEIEREIIDTRRHIDRTLDALAERLSPSGLLDQALHTARNTGGEFTLNLGRTARDNPVPMALLGLGLGWLMVADRRRRTGEDHYGYAYAYEGRGYDLAASDGGDGSYRRRVEATAAGVDRRDVDVPEDWSAAYEAHPRDDIDAAGVSRPTTGGPAVDRTPGPYTKGQAQAGGMKASLAEARQRGSERAHEASENVRDRAERARAAASDTADRVRARGRDAAERMRDRRDRVADRLEDGRRGLAERSNEAFAHAREYRAAAGERATEMYRRSEYAVRSAGWRARDAAATTGQFAREHPLAVGLVVAAAGAVIAGFVPRSRREDEIMGEHSDALKAKARDAARAEADRLRDAATAAMGTAREEARRSGLTADDAKETADKKIASGIGVATAAAQAGLDRAAETGATPSADPARDHGPRPADEVVGAETVDKIKPMPTNKPENDSQPAAVDGVSGLETPPVTPERR